MVYKLELGRMLLSNTPAQFYDADWATDGLNMIAEVIAELRGEEHGVYGWNSLLTSNSGNDEFVNDVFEMRSFCWCDSGWQDYEGPHPDGCPPNFIYKPTGLVITWYKHASRGITANKKYPGARTWFEIIKHCIGSIE